MNAREHDAVWQVLSEDIFLLKQIRVTLDATKISIVDARSLLNAKANQVTAMLSLSPAEDLEREHGRAGAPGLYVRVAKCFHLMCLREMISYGGVKSALQSSSFTIIIFG